MHVMCRIVKVIFLACIRVSLLIGKETTHNAQLSEGGGLVARRKGGGWRLRGGDQCTSSRTKLKYDYFILFGFLFESSKQMENLRRISSF